MTGVTLAQGRSGIGVINPVGFIKRLAGALPAAELIEEHNFFMMDINSIKEILNRLKHELEGISPEELLNKFLSVVPDTASEESYKEAIKKLGRVYKELFPEIVEMLEKFREYSTLDVRRRVWEEIYKPIVINLAEGFAEDVTRLWDYAFNKEDISDNELEKLDLINNWLFLLIKVFAISSRLDDIEKSVELSMFGMILYLKGIRILYKEPEIPVNEAKKILKQDFELIIRKILESGYKFQKTDDYLLFEVLED
ncbi:hypothetical protein [Pyrococcus kukulkanii]|uniref:Uncharacterized protein n=1 Tax=Pyrococcus kukulkanii TaxID=1609559 RepID=A0A127B8Z8_9EURY|nr:hypothetical protein [Pyrococcus kukulkanii]AMM53831.1 hypothetical protein TQ32_04555 [Pyrococcus kukulkanii]